MKGKLELLILVAVGLLSGPGAGRLQGATQAVLVDTKTHAVVRPPTSGTAPDFDYTGINVVGLGGTGSPGGSTLTNQQ